MKFYKAETTCDIEMELIVHDGSDPVFRVFPAGTEVSATPTPVGSDVWHLNVHTAEWETWSGYTGKRNLVIGEVIATTNEGI